MAQPAIGGRLAAGGESILTDGQLKRLAEHKYSSSGTTLMDPFMQRFWNWFVLRIPDTIAPNLLTISGLLVNAVTTLILILYSPDARHDVPGWTMLLFAIGLFVYQTLDACDGKQARRTGSSSPLGELFDHGCDSLSTVFVALASCVAVQMGHYPIVMFYQVIAASTLFYTAHWQTYVSGTLVFGKFDVTEAQFTIIAIHLISAICGSSIWAAVIPLGFISVELKLAMTIFTLGGAVVNIFWYLSSICSGGSGKNGSTIAVPGIKVEVKVIPFAIAAAVHLFMLTSYFTAIFSGGVGKNGSTVAGTSIISPLAPIASVVVSAVIIYIKSPTKLYETNPCLYLLTFGLVIAKVTNKLVVAHMTKHEVKTLDTILIGPAMLILNQYFNTFLSEYFVLWLALVWTLIDVVWYASKVCVEISNHLHINIFSIKPRSPSSPKINSHYNHHAKTRNTGDGGGRQGTRRSGGSSSSTNGDDDEDMEALLPSPLLPPASTPTHLTKDARDEAPDGKKDGHEDDVLIVTIDCDPVDRRSAARDPRLNQQEDQQEKRNPDRDSGRNTTINMDDGILGAGGDRLPDDEEEILFLVTDRNGLMSHGLGTPSSSSS